MPEGTETPAAETLDSIKEEFDGRFDELSKSITEKKEAAESAKGEEAEALSKALDGLTNQVKDLETERDARLEKAANADMRTRVTSLEEELEKARKPQGDFIFGAPAPAGEAVEYGPEGSRSFYADARSTFTNEDPAARERWEGALGKAMTEGTGTAGGFLVPPQVSSELLALRQQDAVLRGLFSSVSVNTTDLRIASVESGLVAGWSRSWPRSPSRTSLSPRSACRPSPPLAWPSRRTSFSGTPTPASTRSSTPTSPAGFARSRRSPSSTDRVRDSREAS